MKLTVNYILWKSKTATPANYNVVLKYSEKTLMLVVYQGTFRCCDIITAALALERWSADVTANLRSQT